MTEKAKIVQVCNILSAAFLLFPCIGYGQLVINEVSQGATGSQEYVEFVVIGSGCNSCVDIRGWIIDDNNGWHITPIGAGQGIASGAMRFCYCNQWACVPAGAIIVVYNDLDPNPGVPPNDPADANNNCVYIIPASSTLLDKTTTFPNSNDNILDNYSTLTWTSGGQWTTTSMANCDDSYQITNPNNTSAPFFSIGWGNNTLLQNVYFAGCATDDVMSMNNTVSNNPFDQNNWVVGSAATNQTPGAPNNAANAAWISGLSNNCNPLPPPVLNLVSTTNPLCNGNCNGSATIAASGGSPPYTYQWNDPGLQTGTTATGLCAGTYYPYVTDSNGCVDTLDTAGVGVVITAPPPLTAPASGSVAPCPCLCSGSAYVFPTGGTPNYTVIWSNGYTDQFQTGLCNGTYNVTVTDANGCAATGTVTLP